jgi:hypothetical protein
MDGGGTRKSERRTLPRKLADSLYPKDLGGLGILDLERLARALRLRWFWFQWKHNNKPWAELELPCDKTYKELFHASTIVKVGKGDMTNFWYSTWLEGRSPRNLAPTLFQNSRRKISRYKELYRITSGLRRFAR